MDHFVWSFDPIAFSFGSIRVFWYGIFFATAILSALEFMKWVYKKEEKKEDSLDSLFLYAVLGVVIGARLGHCLFYDPFYYLSNPMKIIAVWEGGLASHGGGLGVIISLWLYAKKYKFNFLWLLDRMAMPTALFGFFVRIGNFMNSEIVGVESNSIFAIIFTKVDNLPRHPAQLYESIAYLFIFLILIYIYKQRFERLKSGFLFGLFLLLVFSARFIIEFVKLKQASYSSEMIISTGQALSIPFLLLGLVLILLSRKK